MTGAPAIDVEPDAMTPAELQAAARDAYRRAVTHGHTPTGAELGQWFARSDRWGRDRIAECRTAVGGNPSAAGANQPAGDGTDDPDSGRPRGSHDRREVVDGNPNGSHPTARQDGPAVGGSHGAADVPNGSRPAAGARRAGAGPGDPEELWSRRVIRWVTTVAVIVVAACAARSSYEHQRTVVEMAGNHDAAWYLPLSVDGMMLIASLNMLVRRWDGQPTGWLTWTALLLGGAASLAANIAAAEPTWTGRLVAAWSPVCLIVSYELLMQQLPHRAPATGDERTD